MKRSSVLCVTLLLAGSNWFQPSSVFSCSLIGFNECCSKAVGSCGCVDGRMLCCDGELSPYCGCSHDAIAVKSAK